MDMYSNTDATGSTGATGGTDGGKRSAWMAHVKKTMRANKGKPLSAVLKMAKKTYKKSRRGGANPATTALPLKAGRRHGKKKSSSRSRKH